MIGTNLSWILDYSSEITFVDAFRGSRYWVDSAFGTFGDTGGTLDSDGWVTALGTGNDAIARTLIFRDIGGHYPSGDWVILYDGTGTIDYSAGDGTLIDSTPNRHVLRITTPTTAGIIISITATNASPNHVRNIRVIPPGGICTANIFQHVDGSGQCSGDYLSYEAGYATIRFLPQFLDSIKNYSVLRFKDWQSTDSSSQVNWSDRPVTTQSNWVADRPTQPGVPVEIIVELANKLNKDIWVNMPHQASDTYVDSFADYVFANLNANLNVYLEYSNECWNSIFSQAAYCEAQGIADPTINGAGGTNFDKQMRYYSQRSVDVFSIWRTAFGASAGRIKCCMGTQAASTGVTDLVMLWQDANLDTDFLSMAPYFGGSLSEGSFANSDEVFVAIDGSGGGSITEALGRSDNQVSKADTYGVGLNCYEGGQHLTGGGSLFNSVNNDARMYTRYTTYLNALQNDSVSVFVHFQNCSVYGSSGRWGALEYLEEPLAEAPKYDALMDFIEAQSSAIAHILRPAMLS